MLFVGEVALAFVVVVGSGLLLRSLARVVAGRSGFPARRSPRPGRASSRTRATKRRPIRRLFSGRSLRAPGAFPECDRRPPSSALPLMGPLLGLRLPGLGPPDSSTGRPAERHHQRRRARTTFGRCGIPLSAGRLFGRATRRTRLPSSSSTRRLAKLWWPDEEPWASASSAASRRTTPRFARSSESSRTSRRKASTFRPARNVHARSAGTPRLDDDGPRDVQSRWRWPGRPPPPSTPSTRISPSLGSSRSTEYIAESLARRRFTTLAARPLRRPRAGPRRRRHHRGRRLRGDRAPPRDRRSARLSERGRGTSCDS